MKKKLLYALCIILTACIFVGCEAEDMTPGSIYGTITEGGEPLEGAKVSLYTTRFYEEWQLYDVEALLMTTVTASDGVFEFTNLIPGFYYYDYSTFDENGKQLTFSRKFLVKVEPGRQARVDL